MLRVNAVTPLLNAEYTGMLGMLRNASTVDTLTIDPRPASTIIGSTACVHAKTCSRFNR